MLKFILCAALLAALLFAALWVRWRLFLPLGGPRLYAVVLAAGDGAALETQVRAYCLLRGWGLLRAPLLLADAGLSAEGRALAARLAEFDDDILLCPAGSLPEVLEDASYRPTDYRT